MVIAGSYFKRSSTMMGQNLSAALVQWWRDQDGQERQAWPVVHFLLPQFCHPHLPAERGVLPGSRTLWRLICMQWGETLSNFCHQLPYQLYCEHTYSPGMQAWKWPCMRPRVQIKQQHTSNPDASFSRAIMVLAHDHPWLQDLDGSQTSDHTPFSVQQTGSLPRRRTVYGYAQEKFAESLSNLP